MVVREVREEEDHVISMKGFLVLAGIVVAILILM
jgi:hypothetical protein